MDVFKKAKSKFYWYDFTVRDERFRGSTKETNKTRAAKIAALKLADAIKGSDPLDRKPPTLQRVFQRISSSGWKLGDSRRTTAATIAMAGGS